MKIVPGKDPVDLGWQPIAGDRITFETIFTLVLPPHSKGVPDLDQSEMREPFDTMVPRGKAIDEELGRKLTEWAKGASAPIGTAQTSSARREDVPAGAEPLCLLCSKDAANEVFMVFEPAGRTLQGREFEAFWRCPKKLNGHAPVKHAEVLAKLQGGE
jgi:hypothetical protein